MKISRNTQYLASFMVGIGSILNVGSVFVPIGQTGGPKDDYNNLKKDWQAVGSYLHKAMEQEQNDKSNFNRSNGW